MGDQNLAKNLLVLREYLGYTQKDLSNMQGVPRTSYSRWETGKNNPTPMEADRLARTFGLTVKELYETEPDKIIALITPLVKVIKQLRRDIETITL